MTASERNRRLVEFLALFLLLPCLLWGLRADGVAVPVVPVLLGVGALLLLSVRREAPALLRGSLARSWSRAETRRLALQVMLVAILIVAYVLALRPRSFLDLPTRRTNAWLLLLAVYPLLSVVPQELIFRVFLFHRYGPLLRSTAARVVVSALVFGLAHALYENWLTVGLSTVGGLCFAWTFARTGSLVLVVLEHSAYGLLLFTLGLGRIFLLGSMS